MTICIIVEGSYPYITGGVSSWIHQLIMGLPHINFKILSIMPDHTKVSKILYSPPKNLVEHKTVFLNDFLKNKIENDIKKVKTRSEEEVKALSRLIHLDLSVDFEHVLDLLMDRRLFKQSIDFLKSNIFWDNALDVYNSKYSDQPFNDFFWTYRSVFISFMSLIESYMMEADIYHSVSTGYAGLLGAVIKYKTQKPYIITEHGIYPREREEEILKAKWVPNQYKKLWIEYFYYISKIAYRYSDKVITLFTKNSEIQKDIGASEEKIEIISNAVDLEDIEYKERSEKEDVYLVGAILRVTPIKDVMTLIRAFKIVYSKIPEARLLIIGPTDEDEAYFEQCESLIEVLKLRDCIEFTGRVDVKTYYKKIQVLVLTSISEGQPLVILEAMASGVPIVSTDVGGCREMLKPDSKNPSGIITKLVNPYETAEGILKILKDKKLGQTMGKNGRERVEKFYRKEDLMASYNQMYQKLGE